MFHAAIPALDCGPRARCCGNIDYELTATLLLGSVPGVLIGGWLLPKVPADGLRPALACVLLAAALGGRDQGRSDLPPLLIVVLPVSAGLIALLLHRRWVRREARSSLLSSSQPA